LKLNKTIPDACRGCGAISWRICRMIGHKNPPVITPERSRRLVFAHQIPISCILCRQERQHKGKINKDRICIDRVKNGRILSKHGVESNLYAVHRKSCPGRAHSSIRADYRRGKRPLARSLPTLESDDVARERISAIQSPCGRGGASLFDRRNG